jgi:hypothetical protein
MRRVRSSRRVRLRSNERVHGEQQSAPPCAIGVAPTAGVTALAPAFPQALPSLEGIASEYNHEANAELLFDLCAALVRAEMGTPKTWQECGGNSLLFAKHAIMSGIGAERGDLLQRNVEYHLQVSDVAERDGYGASLEEGQLAVTIECSGCGYLKIGPAIDALEEETTGLGAAFYWVLTYALYPVMRLYNHDDALMFEERMTECADAEDAENMDQYEFPEIENALPDCIRKTLKPRHKNWALDARRLLWRFRNGRYRSWIERLRQIQRFSRIRLKQSRDWIENGNYDSPPLPSLLVAFKERDAITACFDEEGQYMLEGTCEPALHVVFSPQKPDEVQHTLRIVGRFVALNYELFQLVEELQQWEKRHAGTGIDRGESPLRAA